MPLFFSKIILNKKTGISVYNNYSLPTHEVVKMLKNIGFEYDFDSSNLNFKNYDELIARAEQYNIKIAFEKQPNRWLLLGLRTRNVL